MLQRPCKEMVGTQPPGMQPRWAGARNYGSQPTSTPSIVVSQAPIRAVLHEPLHFIESPGTRRRAQLPLDSCVCGACKGGCFSACVCVRVVAEWARSCFVS